MARNRLTLEKALSIKATDLKNMDVQEIIKLNKFLSNASRMRVAWTRTLGTSPAEKALITAGVLTDYIQTPHVSEPILGEDGNLIYNQEEVKNLRQHTKDLQYFLGLKTSTRAGYKEYIKTRDRIIKERGILPSVFEVIQEMKADGTWHALTNAGYSTNEIVDLVDVTITEHEDDGEDYSSRDIIDLMLDARASQRQESEISESFFGL